MSIPPAESGSSLDRRIARLIDGGRSGAEPPLYSTDDAASDGLVIRLERLGITASFEQEADSWYCVFWATQSDDGVPERISSGSATTRALAICRAVVNLPLSGTGSRLRLRTASRGWIDSDAHPRPAPSPDTGNQTVDQDADSSETLRAARESGRV